MFDCWCPQDKHLSIEHMSYPLWVHAHACAGIMWDDRRYETADLFAAVLLSVHFVNIFVNNIGVMHDFKEVQCMCIKAGCNQWCMPSAWFQISAHLYNVQFTNTARLDLPDQAIFSFYLHRQKMCKIKGVLLPLTCSSFPRHRTGHTMLGDHCNSLYCAVPGLWYLCISRHVTDSGY